MNKYSALFRGMFLFLPIFMFSQIDENKEKQEVEQVIVSLFDGMREGDSAKVNAVFDAEVIMLTSFKNKDGNQVIKTGELSSFLKAIGTPHDKVWDEKIWNTIVNLDGGIAQVWTEYAFYVGSEFSHCGVDAFHLTQNEQGQWKIVHLMDTRRKEGCSEPNKP